MEINHDKRLGRGLSALLGNNSNQNNNNNKRATVESLDSENVIQVGVNNIIAGIYQPRKSFDHNQLLELSDSIIENGVIQPIIVRKADEKGTFEIIAGERRFKAAKMAGLNQVPVIVKNINNLKALEFAIIENVQRVDLSPIEEAQGYKQLIVEFDYTQEQVAKKIGCSRSHIANILRLLSLPLEVQSLLDQGKITFGHAKVIMNSENVAEIAEQIVKNNWTVRDLEAALKNDNNKIGSKIIKEEVNTKLKNNKSSYQQLSNINDTLKTIFPNTIIKSDYNVEKKQGKIIISFKNLTEIEDLIINLNKK